MSTTSDTTFCLPKIIPLIADAILRFKHNHKLGNLRKKSQQNVSRQESDEISDSPRKTRVFTPFFPGTFPRVDVNNAHISNVGMCNDATVNVTRDVSFRCIVIKTNSRKDAFEESAFDK
jgi:hypothetical protein